VKVEIRVRFNTGEIVEDFVVLYKIEFKAPLVDTDFPISTILSYVRTV